MNGLKRTLAASLSLLLAPASALAFDWEPLIEASYFTGIRTDMLTAVTGIITVLLIIVRCLSSGQNIPLTLSRAAMRFSSTRAQGDLS